LPFPLEDLMTPRLALIAITPDLLAAECSGISPFSDLLGCVIPPAWPPQHWEPHVFDILLAQFARYPEQTAWHRYVALPQPDGTRLLIGTLGAFWRPETPRECEIGYSILPDWEGMGFATEGVGALLDLIRTDSSMSSVIAHTFPALKGSLRVMEKCGFSFDGPGEEAGTVRYRLRFGA